MTFHAQVAAASAALRDEMEREWVRRAVYDSDVGAASERAHANGVEVGLQRADERYRTPSTSRANTHAWPAKRTGHSRPLVASLAQLTRSPVDVAVVAGALLDEHERTGRARTEVALGEARAEAERSESQLRTQLVHLTSERDGALAAARDADARASAASGDAHAERLASAGASMQVRTASLLTSPHLTSSLLTSPHLSSPHLSSPHLSSPPLLPDLTSPHLLPGLAGPARRDGARPNARSPQRGAAASGGGA